MESNITNAFSWVAQLYEETSYLLKDFDEALAGHQFESVHGNYMGSTYVSRNINSPRYWMPRFVARFYRKADQEENSPLLCITVNYFDLEPKPIIPVLQLGWAQGMEHEKQSWEHWWFFSAYFNKGDNFDYFDYKEKKEHSITHKAEIRRDKIKFVNKLNDDSYLWPKTGKYFSIPLLEVKNNQDIKALSDELEEMWAADIEEES